MFTAATMTRAGTPPDPKLCRLSLWVLAATLVTTSTMAEPAPTCVPEPLGSAWVRSAIDGRVLELADGRRLRLAGIDSPFASAGDPLQNHLQTLAAGQRVRIGRLGPDDRYGRIVALVHRNDESSSLQETLLEQGLARVGLPLGPPPCAQLLLAAERKARTAGRGLWSHPAMAVRSADEPQALRADLGRLVLVEGRVLSVRSVGGIIYLNFSRRWTKGFTATVFKRNLGGLESAGISLQGLAGRSIIVRGILEERNGLQMELAEPGQIEISGL